jgi:hypothetical protein
MFQGDATVLEKRIWKRCAGWERNMLEDTANAVAEALGRIRIRRQLWAVRSCVDMCAHRRERAKEQA